jgi:hypothetical protein
MLITRRFSGKDRPIPMSYARLMRIFRLILIFSLCIAVPFQGIAGTLPVSAPCPMMQGNVDTMMHSMADMNNAAQHDCCNDADTLAKTGKLCKTGQECPSSSVYLPEPFLAIAPSFSASSPSFSRDTLAITRNTSLVWRPPV